MSEETQRKPGAAPPPEEKPNRRSSVYAYLAILFGAAFLMLLLAYFVQQRNNATVQADLRTTTASKDELLENIQRLERENLDLVERNEALDAQLSGLREELEGANASYEDLEDSYDKYVGYTSILEALYASEVMLEAGDYAGAAAELTDIEFDYFTRTIDNYDGEMEHYNPEGMLLRPRFDALVSALTQQGELDESWTGQE